MTQPIHLIGEYYAVEVPSMAFGPDINNYGDESELMYMLSMEDIADEPEFEETLITKKLPPGNWQIICTSKECTEEQAKGIVEYDAFTDGYKDYDTDRFHHEDPFIKALDSLRSLLITRGCDPNKNYVIIKKVK